MLGSTRIRFIKSWQLYCVGQIITPPAMLRDWLLAMKICEVATDHQIKPITIEEAKAQQHQQQQQQAEETAAAVVAAIEENSATVVVEDGSSRRNLFKRKRSQ